jgi:protein gp37
MTTTSIEWTDKTWNPVRGCSLVSPGCTNCYAMKQAHRFSAPGRPYAGLTVLTEHHGPRWSGVVRTVPEMLAEPLRWRKPCRIFVNSMSDLFHESVPDEYISAVFAVMAACPQHTFQILTKRAERMAAWFTNRSRAPIDDLTSAAYAVFSKTHPGGGATERATCPARGAWTWPLPNVWIGVSVEDQQRADERIPCLLRIPAAVRFLSCEPLLGPLDLKLHPMREGAGPRPFKASGIDWVIIGGESGPGARPFDLAWGRSIVEQCKAAGVPVFMKQLGSQPVQEARGEFPGWHGPDAPPETWLELLRLRDPKGGDMAEWPADLRVREMPRSPL